MFGTIRPTSHGAWALVPCALLAFAPVPAAHAQDQLWITQFGRSGWDHGNALAPDGTGGVMVAGRTDGSLGGPNAGSSDAFLARYDGAGNRLWIRQFGTSTTDGASALVPDGAGGVMVAGYTWGSLGGANAGGGDVFLARYDSEGNQLSIHQFGSSESKIAHALAADGAGGVFVAGWTTGSLGGPFAGGEFDAWVARYDGAGKQLWIRQFSMSNWDWATALASDGAGGVMVAGLTGGSFGGPHGAGTADAFLTRYDSTGNQLWITQFGTTGEDDAASEIVPDGAGGVLIAGYSNGSLGGPNAGGGDAFLARYDSAGNRLWIRQFGTTGNDSASGIAPDGAGGVLFAGSTQGSLGGPNAGPPITYDVFLGRYDSDGNRLWIRQFGTSGQDSATSLALDGAGGVMIVGDTFGSLAGPNAGRSDVFLAHYEIDSCYPDCDRSTGAGVLDLVDFICFGSSFVLGEPYACDCDTSTGPGVCDLLDFICFQTAFVAGCP